jgi:hypothetical protein
MLDKYKQLEKTIEDLIKKDKLILEKKNIISNTGLKFIKNDIHLEIDYTTLKSELFINISLKDSKKFLEVYNIDEIDFSVKNFQFVINEIEFLEDEEDNFVSLKNKVLDEDKINILNLKKDDNTRIRKIEDEINELLDELKDEYIKLGKKIDSLLENNFADFIEDDNAYFKEKVSNFIKSFKTKRTKRFVKSIIKDGIITKRRIYTNEINELKSKITKKLLFDDGVRWSEWSDFFAKNKIYKNRDKNIKKLLKDIKFFIDDIIDDVFIELARETFEISSKLNKYNKNNIREIEINKRILLNEVWKEIKILFDRLGLIQNNFRAF